MKSRPPFFESRKTEGAMNPITVVSSLDEILTVLRGAGWRVAVHNDYSLNGMDMTFWLLTHPCGVYVKGEGRTDQQALFECERRARELFKPSP